MDYKKQPLCKVIRTSLIILFISLLAIYSFMSSDSKNSFTIATGSKSGAYYKYAKIYQEILAKDGISLKIQTTAGSEEALELLDKNMVDMAFIQGGSVGENEKFKNNEDIKSIASVFYEPLWVFYRANLDIKRLYELKGKTISVGSLGSGSRVFSMLLLKDNHIDKSNSKILDLSSDKGYEKLKNGQIDALFISVSPSSNILNKLIKLENIELMNFNRHIAYKDKYEYVTSLVLGEGVIDLADNIPNSDKKLLATTANLVVDSTSVSPEKVRLILKRVKQVHKHGGIFEKVNFFPSPEFVEFELHPAAEIYFENGDGFLEQYLPYWLTSLISNSMIIILPAIPALIVFFKFILPFYTRKATEFIYLQKEEIRQIESNIDGLEDNKLLSKLRYIKKLLAYRCDIYYMFQSDYYDVKLYLSEVEDSVLQNISE